MARCATHSDRSSSALASLYVFLIIVRTEPYTKPLLESAGFRHQPPRKIRRPRSVDPRAAPPVGNPPRLLLSK